MLKIEEFVTPSPEQWAITIKGMRNAMNSWDRMDSHIYPEDCQFDATFVLGENDRDLAMRLNKGGAPHAKYRRMLPIHVTINAPLYWWKEFETYRIGVASNPSDIEFNSCSTMHRIHSKEFTLDDFSHEHLFDDVDIHDECLEFDDGYLTSLGVTQTVIDMLNKFRKLYLDAKERLVTKKSNYPKVDEKVTKDYWWQMIQLLPSSYMQKRTVSLNYQVAYELYTWRNPHKLDEWSVICRWIEELPYSELITGERDNG